MKRNLSKGCFRAVILSARYVFTTIYRLGRPRAMHGLYHMQQKDFTSARRLAVARVRIHFRATTAEPDDRASAILLLVMSIESGRIVSAFAKRKDGICKIQAHRSFVCRFLLN